jgi:hypothetical protein
MSDVVRELADRIKAKQARGEEWEFEFAIEFNALTRAEQSEFLALMEQRSAHGEEQSEAVNENVRILKLLFAYQEGNITEMEFVECVRGVFVA